MKHQACTYSLRIAPASGGDVALQRVTEGGWETLHSEPIYIKQSELDALTAQCTKRKDVSPSSLLGVGLAVLPDREVSAVRYLVARAEALFGMKLTEEQALRIHRCHFGGGQ